MINALCGIGGADPNQLLANLNTALHVAADAGIPANVQNLLAHLSQVNWRNSEGKTALLLAGMYGINKGYSKLQYLFSCQSCSI